MATTVWVSQNGAWNDAASWTNGVPGPGADTAIFDGTSQVPATSNLDQAGDDLGLIYISQGHTGDIGGLGNPLKLGSGKIVQRGEGVLYLQATTNDVDHLIVNTNHSRVSCVLSAGTNAVGRLRVEHGRCAAGGKLGTVEVTDGGICDITPYADTLDFVMMDGGTCVFRREIATNLIISGGTYTQNLGKLVTLIQTGGTVNWGSPLTATNADWVITTAYVFGGVLDALINMQPKGITSLFQWPKAVVRRTDDIVSVTNVYDMTGELRP